MAEVSKPLTIRYLIAILGVFDSWKGGNLAPGETYNTVKSTNVFGFHSNPGEINMALSDEWGKVLDVQGWMSQGFKGRKEGPLGFNIDYYRWYSETQSIWR